MAGVTATTAGSAYDLAEAHRIRCDSTSDRMRQVWHWVKGQVSATTAEPLPASGQNAETETGVGPEQMVLIEKAAALHISDKNLQAIQFLDEWFAEPDDLGQRFWDDFTRDLQTNRFTIP